MSNHPAFEFRSPRYEDFPEIELYMDQVLSVLEKYLSPFFPGEKAITSTMINNYVKQKLLPPPQNKRYSKDQLTRLFMICILKSHMALSQIAALMENAEKDCTAEELFRLFSAELDRSLDSVWQNPLVPEDNKKLSLPHKTLRAALMAFSAILYSKQVFAQAEALWPPRETEEEKKEKAKKEKKEKKEKEKKEKKDS